MADEKFVTVNQLKTLENSRPTGGGGSVTIDTALSETSINPVENKAIDAAIKDHTKTQVSSDTGVHGFKYINNKLQYFNGKDWVTIETGGGGDGGEGLPPGDMKSVFAIAGMDGVSAVLKGVDPDDTLVKWAGTRIVRKVGSYPTSVSDGVQVVDYQTRNQYANTGYVDTGLVSGETYYYRWFPYSDKGAVNMSEGAVNRHICTPINNLVVGVIADWENNTYTRTDYAVGLNAGDDFNQFKMYGQRRRCIVTDDRAVLAFYGDEAYTENGKLLMDVEKNGKTYPAGTNVQVMVYQPKFYYKVTPLELEPNPDSNANGRGYIMRKAQYQISEFQYEGFKLHPNFIRAGVEYPYILLAAYEGCMQNSNDEYIVTYKTNPVNDTTSKLCSVAKLAPPKEYSDGSYDNAYDRPHFRTFAMNRGTGWQLCDLISYSCTQLLFMIEYATMNCQSVIGIGNCRGLEKTGKTSSFGNSSGRDNSYTEEYKGSVTYRGEENLWGNTETWLDGVNLYKGAIYYGDSNYTDGSTTGAGYTTETGYYFPFTSGFIKSFGYSTDCDFMFLPSETGKDSINPVGDYVVHIVANNSPFALLTGYDDYYQSTDTNNTVKPYWSGLFYYNSAKINKSSRYDDESSMSEGNRVRIRGSRLVCIPPEGAVEELLA